MPTRRITPAEMTAALAALDRYGSVAGAAQALGIPRQTLHSRLERARAWVGLGRPEGGAAPLPPTERLKSFAQEEEIRRLRRELRELQLETLNAAQVRETVFGLAQLQPNPPDWLLSVKDPAGHDPGVPLAAWGDWHYGERVSLEQTGDFNAFDTAICKARVRRLVEKMAFITRECLVHKEPYPGLVLALLGDFLSGDIHEDLRETNTLPTTAALCELFSLFVWAIDRLLELFGRVYVVAVPGNHTRTTALPRYKNRAFLSYDWLLYQILESHYKTRIEAGTLPITAGGRPGEIIWHCPPETDAQVRVFGHTYNFSHGDALGVRGGDALIGFLGPIVRGNLKTQRAAAGLGAAYDTLVLGHFHQHVMLNGLIVNGSLKGYDELAKIRRYRPEPPEQILWFHHPRLGIVWPSRLYLENPRKGETPSKEWLEWPKH